MTSTQSHIVLVRCRCGTINGCHVVMPFVLDPMDSDKPQHAGIVPCRCDCGRTATVRMTLEATPNGPWVTEEG